MAITWDLPEAVVLDPLDEAERLEALQSLNLLGTEAEDRFDRITQLAAEFFQVPMAYVAFFDAEHQYFKSSVGFCPTVSERNLSLCQYTLRRNDPLVIHDAQDHSLTRNHPMVTGEPGLRFYAGVPLAGPRGKKIGTFCLLDLKPREFGSEQLAQLKTFAVIVEREINLTGIIQTQNDLLRTREQLVEAQAKLRHEFDDAIKYVRLMLPPPLAGREIIDWQFHPSTHLGGDGLGYRRINADQIAFYILDVTGHGLGSALLAVTALELLRSRAVRELDYARPAQVIERLNRTFQMKDHAGKFFSAWYGVYTHSEKKLVYATGGHPAPVLLREGRLEKIGPGGPSLGVLPELIATETTIDFPRSSQICLFTDGLYEVLDEKRGHGSYDEFFAWLQNRVAGGAPLYESMLDWMKDAHGRGAIDDDVTLLRFMTKR